LIYVEPIPGSVNTYGLGMTADLNGTGYQDPPLAPSGSVDFRYYGGLALRLERVVNNDEPFRLPSGFLARRHSIEIEGDVPIEIIGLGDSREELG